MILLTIFTSVCSALLHWSYCTFPILCLHSLFLIFQVLLLAQRCRYIPFKSLTSTLFSFCNFADYMKQFKVLLLLLEEKTVCSDKHIFLWLAAVNIIFPHPFIPIVHFLLCFLSKDIKSKKLILNWNWFVVVLPSDVFLSPILVLPRVSKEGLVYYRIKNCMTK